MLLETLITILTLFNTGFSNRLYNVALEKNGGTCVGASSGVHPCSKAIDGKLDASNMWYSYGEGEGAWIKLNFSDIYLLKVARFMQHSSKHEQSKTLMLTFSDRSSQIVTLTENNATTYAMPLAVWDSFELQPVWTNTVKITVLTVYSKHNNGFREVEFYSYMENCSSARWAEGFQAGIKSCVPKGNTYGESEQEVRLCNKTCSTSIVTAKQNGQGLEVNTIMVLCLCIVQFLCFIGIVLLLWYYRTKKTTAVSGNAAKNIDDDDDHIYDTFLN